MSEKCKVCADPDFDHDTWSKGQMDKYGWYAHYVPLPLNSVVNAHTHGFEATFHHPNVQLFFSLPMETSHSIFATIAENIRNGTVYRTGEKYTGVLGGGYGVEFVHAKEGGRPVLRCLLPDKEGRLPSDPACEKPFADQLNYLDDE